MNIKINRNENGRIVTILLKSILCDSLTILAARIMGSVMISSAGMLVEPLTQVSAIIAAEGGEYGNEINIIEADIEDQLRPGWRYTTGTGRSITLEPGHWCIQIAFGEGGSENFAEQLLCVILGYQFFEEWLRSQRIDEMCIIVDQFGRNISQIHKVGGKKWEYPENLPDIPRTTPAGTIF